MAMANLVIEDPSLRDMLYQFVKDYAEAQHAIEITNVAGTAAFELILTIIVAAVTGGVGVVAAVGSKAHLIKKFQKVGDLLSDFAKATRKLKLEGKKRKAKGNTAKFSDMETDQVQAKKTDAHGAEDGKVSKKDLKTNPKDIRAAAQNWPPEKKARFDIADQFYKEAGYKDYDNHLRGIDFDSEVEVITLNKGTKLYQYSYIDEDTGLPKTGSYFYSDSKVDASKLGFDVDDRKMYESSLEKTSELLKSKAANIEDWEPGSHKVFSGGETQLFNPNLTLSKPNLVK